MGRPRKKLPELVPHRNRARLWWAGEWHYLGAWGSDEAKRKYAAFLAEIAVDPARAVRPADDYLMGELMADFLALAKREFEAKRAARTKRAAELIAGMYTETPVREFGPVAFEAWQRAIAREHKYSVAYVRYLAREVLEAFRWAIRTERVNARDTKYDAMRAVPQITAKHARPAKKVKPVSAAHVEATLPFLRGPVRAMADLQGLTGARPGELCIMRPADVHKAGVVTLSSGLTVDLAGWGGVWVYVPDAHKTEHLGKPRDVLIGPKAQAVLAPFLARDPAAFCFCPRETVASLRADQRAARKSKVQPSQVDRRKVAPKRAPRERYDPHSYWLAVRRACDRAGIPRWHPHQLRHTAATDLQTLAGLDAVRAILGHSDPRTTTRYAERDFELAAEWARKLG